MRRGNLEMPPARPADGAMRPSWLPCVASRWRCKTVHPAESTRGPSRFIRPRPKASTGPQRPGMSSSQRITWRPADEHPAGDVELPPSSSARSRSA